jgi:predicted metal-binding membrane protein
MRVAIAVVREIISGRAWPILACSAAGWGLVVGLDHSILVPTLCAPGGTDTPTVAAVVAQVTSCVAMLLAMMTPLVWLPLTHVWDRSLAERRVRAVLLFLCGYFGAWTVAMAILTFLAVALRLVAESAIASFAIAAGIAFLWQMTPIKARFLRRCHAVRPLPAFGFSAEVASIRYGTEVGSSCIATCWAIMLLPLTVDAGHAPIMAATALLMLSERYSDKRYLWAPIEKLKDMISANFRALR